LNKLGKHPRLARGYEFAGDPTRVKQPRPNEDGNWTCDHCGNINFPRRKQCNKCGEPRGESGDAAVAEYVRQVQVARGEAEPKPGEEIPQIQHPPAQQPAMAAMGMAAMGMPMQMQMPMMAATQAANPHEGIHVVTFKPSATDLSEEGHVLGQQILEGMQQCAGSAGVAAAAELLAHASAYVRSAAAGTAPVLPTPRDTNVMPQMQMTQMPIQMTQMPVQGAAMGYMSTTMPMVPQGGKHPINDWDYWQHHPSEWLKEFGDPMAAAGARGEMKADQDGKWRCEKCNNINFPRREACNKCGMKRGRSGDMSVQRYVYRCIQDRMSQPVW
jgi:hypothetical protein